MSAYMIVVANVHDREKFLNGYGAAAAELIKQFGGHYLLRAPGAMLLEGNFGDGASMVISEWPDKDAVLKFWNSPEYAKIKTLRDNIADCQVHIIEAPTIKG